MIITMMVAFFSGLAGMMVGFGILILNNLVDRLIGFIDDDPRRSDELQWVVRAWLRVCGYKRLCGQWIKAERAITVDGAKFQFISVCGAVGVATCLSLMHGLLLAAQVAVSIYLIVQLVLGARWYRRQQKFHRQVTGRKSDT